MNTLVLIAGAFFIVGTIQCITIESPSESGESDEAYIQQLVDSLLADTETIKDEVLSLVKEDAPEEEMNDPPANHLRSICKQAFVNNLCGLNKVVDEACKFECEAKHCPFTDSNPDSCHSHAELGHCKLGGFVAWMATNCKKSCMCKRIAVNAIHLPAICEQSFVKERCSNNAVVARSCRPQCEAKYCPFTNSNPNCQSYADQGYCAKYYVAWMNANCRKSCKCGKIARHPGHH